MPDLGVGGADELDRGGLEQLGDGLARFRAEHRQRALLRGHEQEPDAIGAHAPRLPRRHQRELVERQGPRRLVRHHEGDAIDIVLLGVAQEPVQRLLVDVLAKGDGPLIGGCRAGAGRQDEVVVRDPLAVPGADRLLLRIDRGDGVAHEAGIELGRDAGEAVAVRVAHRERRGHGHRPIGEGLVRCDQCDVDAITGEITEGDEGLERRHAATGDHDAREGRFGHTLKLRVRGHASIGTNCGPCARRTTDQAVACRRDDNDRDRR